MNGAVGRGGWGQTHLSVSPKDTCFPVIYPRLTPVLRDLIKTEYFGDGKGDIDINIKLGEKTELKTPPIKKNNTEISVKLYYEPTSFFYQIPYRNYTCSV